MQVQILSTQDITVNVNDVGGIDDDPGTGTGTGTGTNWNRHWNWNQHSLVVVFN